MILYARVHRFKPSRGISVFFTGIHVSQSLLFYCGGGVWGSVDQVCEASPDNDHALVLLLDVVGGNQDPHCLHSIRLLHMTDVHQSLVPK